MTSGGEAPEPYFIAYIDEAGDPGVNKVAPIDANGASEWFTVGCTVVRATTEPNLVDVVRSAKAAVYSTQSPDLHFRTLVEHKKKTNLRCARIRQPTLFRRCIEQKEYARLPQSPSRGRRAPQTQLVLQLLHTCLARTG